MEMEVKNTIPKYNNKKERIVLVQRAYVNLQKQMNSNRAHAKSGEK